MERYYSLNKYLREKFGCKVYKLALDGGFTCPTRDGTLGTRGCIFCSGKGSGDFAVPVGDDVFAAVGKAKEAVAGKGGEKFIAYFQSFTGTYAPTDRLERLYSQVISHPDIAALSIGTRPDCLGDDVLDLLCRLNREKPVWLELGLQTVHESTAEYIGRGYKTEVFDDAARRLSRRGLEFTVHMIIGLPGESDEMIFETAQHIGESGAKGVKFQLLHILRGTPLAEEFEKGAFSALAPEHYVRLLEGCIERIPPDMVVHRLTGDGAKSDLIAPLWSGDKKHVLGMINRAFEKDGIVQGRLYKKA